MPVDPSIIQRHGAYEVLAHPLAITWPDDSTVGLHAVQHRGHADRYLRALPYDTLLWLVIDVRHLAASLATEIPALPWSDTEGLVLHTLRLEYRNADSLRVRALTHFKAGWAALPGSPPPLRPVRAGRTMDATCWQRSGAMAPGATA